MQDDSSACSVFTFDIAANKSRLPLAKNAVRKSRTLRHPGVIKVLDTIEVCCCSIFVRGFGCFVSMKLILADRV